MPAARLLVLFALTLVFASSAQAATPRAIAAPTGLKAFLLRASEPTTHEFPRTPSFAWNPVRGAASYEFQLSTSPRFNESAIVWEKLDALIPAVAPDVSLPWITGRPYALYARARAVSQTGASGWSRAYGVNIRWPSLAQPLPAAPGLVRWTPIEGATSYEVLYVNAGHKRFATMTNVADMRDYYTFHQDPFWSGMVQWRVRAVRKTYGDIPNGMPAVQYGPWSPVYTALNPPFATGPLALGAAISDVTSDAATQHAHELTPGFTFSGSGYRYSGAPAELYRVYIFTDSDCVNTVFRGAVVGSPAYAPRMSGPLKLPGDQKTLGEARAKILRDGPEGKSWTFASEKVTSTETPAAAGTASKVDLWDTHWPTGRYYWTVVPVDILPDRESEDPANTNIEYTETIDPQDGCRMGLARTFGKTAKPVVTVSGAPFVSGLSQGRLVAAKRANPSIYRTPLVAWQPARGADEYEIQWGRKPAPFVAEGKLTTGATSATLCAPSKPGTQQQPQPAPSQPSSGSGGSQPPTGSQPAAPAPAPTCAALAPGTWYYRVRGLNYGLPKRPGMTWSEPVAVRVVKPSFAILPR